MDVVQSSLALFQPPLIETGIQREYWVEYSPVSSISSESCLEFSIPGTSMDYINLKKSRLCIEFKITKENGDPIKYEADALGMPTDNSDQVAPINFPLNTIFRQVDVSLNQMVIAPQTGVNHPFKTILDLLLTSTNDMLTSQAQGGLFFKDTAGNMDDVRLSGSNNGFVERSKLIRNGNVATIEGVLYNDFILDQDRLLLNGVAVNIKLFQAKDEFRLLTSKDEKYKFVITNATFKVCQVAVNPSMILAHNEILAGSPAVYPFWRSDIKSYTVATGSHTFMIDNLYHGNVPSKILLGMVTNDAYSGSYALNPFNFSHNDVNYLEISVDGTPVPHRPFKPNFEQGDYLSSYLSLMDSDYTSQKGICINSSDYPRGYSLFLFDIQSYLNTNIMSKPVKGLTQLNMRFGTALPKPINVIVYAKFADKITIDQSRQVDLSGGN